MKLKWFDDAVLALLIVVTYSAIIGLLIAICGLVKMEIEALF